MEFLIILLLLIYLLSPIPLLVMLILEKRRNISESKTFYEHERDYKNTIKKLKDENEELKRTITSLRGELYVKNHNSSEAEINISRPEVLISTQKAKETYSSNVSSLPNTYESVSHPIVTSENVVVPKKSNNLEDTNSSSKNKDKSPRERKLLNLIDASNTGFILTVGVVLILLAAIGFMSATWTFLADGIRAIFLLSLSAIFLGAGVLAKTKFKLPSTALAFYSIGSAALPVTIIGASAFELLGNSFILKGDNANLVFITAILSLLLLTTIGALFFKSKVFSLISLFCIPPIVIALITMSWFENTSALIVIAICATIINFGSLLIRKISEESIWNPYRKTYNIFSVTNQYIMALLGFIYSSNGVLSGILMLVLGIGFILGTFLTLNNPLLSIPHIVLVFIGLAQLIEVNSVITIAIWFLISGIYFVLMSLVPIIKKPLNKIFEITGLISTFIMIFPLISYQTDNNDSFIFIPLLVIAALVFVFFILKHNFAHLFCVNVVFFEVFLWNLGLLIFNSAAELSFIALLLIGNIVFYLAYTLIKHPLYSVFTDAMLYLATLFFMYYFIEESRNNYLSLTIGIALMFMLIGYTLFNAYKLKSKSCFASNALSNIYQIIWSLVPFILISSLNYYESISLLPETIFIIFALCLAALSILIYTKNNSKYRLVFLSSYVMLFIYALLLIPLYISSYTTDLISILSAITNFIPFITSVALLAITVRKNGLMSHATISPSNGIMIAITFAIYNFLDFLSEVIAIKDEFVILQIAFCIITLAILISLFVLRMVKYSDKKDSFLNNMFGNCIGVGTIWAIIYSFILFISLIASHDSLVVFSILLINFFLIMLLFRYEYKAVSIISSFLLAFTYIGLIELFDFATNSDSVLLHLYYSLLFLIPVILLSILTIFDKNRKVSSDPIFWGSLVLAGFSFFYNYEVAFWGLFSFVIVIISTFIRKPTKENAIRAICLSITTLSTGIWFGIPLSESHIITCEKSQFMLIPTTLFVISLPWIIPSFEKYKNTINKLRLVYSYFFMLILGIITLDSNTLPDMLAFAIISAGILVVAFLLHSRNYVLLGSICTLCFMAYMINEVVGKMSWLVYLAITGTILISVAVRNEIKRRNQAQSEDKIEK